MKPAISVLIPLFIAFSSAAAQDPSLVYGVDSKRDETVPQGVITKHTWRSDVFPGTFRDYWVYVPQQYDGDSPAGLMVFQDGKGFVKPDGHSRVPTVFDNLIHKMEMPVTIGLFINPGVIPPSIDGGKPRRNRSFEYDTLSDRYARFLLEEMLPELEKNYVISERPEMRAICGNSSGGICAFTVAWQRPDAFRKVVSHIGSFVNIRGGHAYPSMVRKVEPKPLRVFLQGGTADLDNLHGNWPLASRRLAKALAFKGYDYKLVMTAGRHQGTDGGKLLPETLRWLWRDWKEMDPEN